MSRSIKKNPILQYGSRYKGRRYNKKFRVRNKHEIRMGRDPFQMNELINPWDVHDVWSLWDENRKWNPKYWTEEEIQRLKRHYFNK